MAINKINCPKCLKAFGVLERQLGGEVHCPHCGERVKAPGPPPAKTSPQDDAIAQMFGPEPSKPAKPSAPPLASAAPPPPLARPAKPTNPVASKAAAAGTASPAGLHPDHGDHHGPDRLAAAPIHSRTTVWVILGVFIAALAAIGLGIYYYGAHRTAAESTAESPPVAAANAVSGNKPAAPGVPGSPGAAVVRSAASPAAAAPAATDQPAEDASAKLVLHQEIREAIERTLKPSPTLVYISYVENKSTEVIRRGSLAISSMSADQKTVFGSQSFEFRDVQPGEKVYFAFEYPYSAAASANITYAPQLASDSATTRPAYKFETVFLKFAPDGRRGSEYGGTAVFQVANTSPQDAPVVDVFVLIYNPAKELSGFARGQVRNLKAGATAQANCRWDFMDRADVASATARAQIGGEN